jgi:hypothetical protein
MLMTTIGSDYFPKTASGRVLCFLLALCAIALCGYLTATLATFFVRQDASELTSRNSGYKINSSSANRNYCTAKVQACLTKRFRPVNC